MRFISSATLLAFISVSGPCLAAKQDDAEPLPPPSSIQSYESGFSLMESCSNPAQRAYCVGYIVGVLDAYNALAGTRADMSFRICLPTGVRKSEVAIPVINYFTETPEALSTDASSEVFKALTKAFPCR